jgi:hypothetical protein
LLIRSLDKLSVLWSRRSHEVLKRLKGEYGLLSRDSVWLEREMAAERLRFYVANKFVPHEYGIELCREYFLQQSGYFLQRDLLFLRDSADVLRKELARDCVTPCRVFTWDGGVRPTTTTTTAIPGWRVVNFLMRSLVFVVTCGRFFGGYLPFGSPFRVNVVCSCSENVGGSCDGSDVMTLSVRGRVRRVWRMVGKRNNTQGNHHRSKNVSLMRKLAVYLLFGVVPTVFYCVVFPLVCLGVWAVGVVGVVGAVLW